MVEPQYVCGAAIWVGTQIQKASQSTRPTNDYAEPLQSGKKAKNRSEGEVCLLTKGVLIRVGHALLAIAGG
jgi:hypothetical protein